MAVSEKQAEKIGIHIGDILKGTAWTKKYPEIEFANYYRAGGIKKLDEKESGGHLQMSVNLDTVHTRYDGTPIPRVCSADYPGPPWTQEVPPLEIYAWRGERMLSKAAWKGKCFRCIWANMANVTIQYDFDRNIVKSRFETFYYGPLSCKYYSMGPARADERMLSMHYDYSEYTGGAHGYYWDGGATFDTETGARITLGDICTDMGELARIVASILYAEDASRFSISEAEMAQKIAANEVSPDNVDSWFCRCLLLQV